MENLKFKDLVIPQLDESIDELLEQARKDLCLERKAFEKILEDGKIISMMEDGLTDMVLGNQQIEYIEDWKKTLLKNQDTIINEHKELFLYFFVFVHVSHSVFYRLKDEFNGKKVDTADTIRLTMLGTLCRMADEISVMLTHGAVKSALAQWRAFYEHAVVGIFLMKENSEQLYKLFADHSHRDVKKKADSFNKQREALKFPPLSENQSNAINERTASLTELYGTSFFEDYAWAKSHLTERPTFWAIEQKAEMGKYRPFYIWASSFTHPNFHELVNFLDENGRLNIGDVTRPAIEKQSFVDPVQLTLSVFYCYLDYFLHHYSVDYQYEVNILAFRKIYDKMASCL